MSIKKLIVNADDFGQSKGINKGIIRAYENGIVSSASLMVRYPAAIEAAIYSKNNHTLGVGLHIDLGEWVCDDGKWNSLYEVVSLDDIEAVKTEIYRQLESFYRLMEKKPTHIDSHQHVHQKESVLPIVVEIANRLNITLRGNSQKVNYCGSFYGQLEDGSAFRDAISVASLNKIILNLPEGINELACHPGFADDVKTMYKNERAIEVNTLCDASVKKTITKSKIRLCSFLDISF